MTPGQQEPRSPEREEWIVMQTGQHLFCQWLTMGLQSLEASTRQPCPVSSRCGSSAVKK